MKNTIQCVMSGLLLSLGSPAVFADALESLVADLKPVASMTAHFKQVITDESGKNIGHSEGKFSYVRPGRFRWEVNAPEHTLLVADGKNVWNYDTDLEQVSVNPLQTQENTPAILLSGDTDKIGHLFKVEIDKNCPKSQQCYRLTPSRPDQLLQWLNLRFNQQMMQSMEFRDQIGNKTSLQFTDAKKNPTLEAGLFQFKVPKGVDVVGTPVK